MPAEEGLALYEAGLSAPAGPLLEIGSYCGKSAVYLGAAARERGTVLYSIDHHRGSEEHQPGEEYHDPALVDAHGRVDTFPEFRRTIEGAGLTDVVVPLVAPSSVVARGWTMPLAFVFVDGGHSQAAADDDFAEWAPHVTAGGLLAIHDVFEDPAEGGHPPYVIYRRAIDSGAFAEVSRAGSLRVLERTGVA
ncbi:MAG TPA: class I SAM-dependent methyltransferase [Actinomycetota bacterium]|nr:class I SAM-dependent methyltransferase [Actinomycetota bacterium]